MRVSHRVLRRLLAWLCVIVALLATLCAVGFMLDQSATRWRINYLGYHQGAALDMDSGGTQSRALTMRLDAAERTYQIGLAVMAALWGLVLAKRGEFGLNREHRPELVMFFAANWLLLLCLVAYPTLQLDVATALSYTPTAEELLTATPNRTDNVLWDRGVWRYADVAQATLLAAVLAVGCTILSTRLLAENSQSDTA